MTLPAFANDTQRMDPLAALFLRYRDGDVEALGEVFDRTAPQLLRLAMHLTHRGADAEDLLQATFVLAMRKAGTFAADRPLLPWLCALLAGQAANSNRALQRRRDEPLPELIADDQTPNDAAARAELVAMLRSGVDTLSPEQRQVLLLQLQHGLTPTEIAEVLDVPPGAVRMRLHRGLEALRRLLPAGLALWLGALLPTRGLAMVRTAVMQRAGTTATTIAGATALGGMVLMKKVLLGVAVLLLGLLWWQGASDPTLAAPPSASGAAIAATGTTGSASDGADADPTRDPVRTPAAATLGTLRVRVRSGSAGVGLQGVPVLAWRGEGERPPLDGAATIVLTDAAGEAVFAALTPGVWHCAPGEAFAMPARALHVANAEATADFTVATRTLRGIVVDEHGTPVAKATIHVSSLRNMDFAPMGERSSRPDLRLRIGARSGDDGTFACEIRDDEDHVGAQHPDFATSCSHLTSANLVDDVRLILRPKRAPVVGKVVDSMGRPIADAVVACMPVDQTGRQRTVDGTWQGAPLPICMRTDAGGGFRCAATLPGRVLVWANAPGKRAGEVSIDPTAEPERVVEVVLSDALTVTGFVRRADGTPAPAVVIHATGQPDAPGTYETRTTQVDGSFRMEQLPASGFWLLVGHQQLPLLSRQIPPDSGVVQVELVLPKTYLLQGRILDRESRGVPDCSVTANLMGPQRCGYHVSADAQGRFTMPDLPNGRLRVEVSVWGDPDSSPAIVQEDVSPLDGELVLRIPAHRLPRCSAAGRIVDPSGNPVGGAIVALEWDDGGNRRPLERSTATDGTFRFENLPARSFLLRADRIDPPARKTRRIDLTGGKQLELGDITLPPCARLLIEFVRSDDSPWRGMRPEFTLRRDNAWCHDRIDWTPHGFTAWLEPGRIRLRIDEPGLIAAEMEIDLIAGETRHLRLPIDIGRSKDIVFRGDGKEPIDPKDVLHATLTDSRGSVQTFVTRRSPHGDGHWHLYRTVPYGTYQVTAHTDSGARYAGSFTAEDSLTDPSRVEVPSTR